MCYAFQLADLDVCVNVFSAKTKHCLGRPIQIIASCVAFATLIIRIAILTSEFRMAAE